MKKQSVFIVLFVVIIFSVILKIGMADESMDFQTIAPLAIGVPIMLLLIAPVVAIVIWLVLRFSATP